MQPLNAIMLGGASRTLGGAGPYADSAAKVRFGVDRAAVGGVRVSHAGLRDAHALSTQIQASIKAAAAAEKESKLQHKAGGKSMDKKKWSFEETVALIHLHNVAMKINPDGGPSE